MCPIPHEEIKQHVPTFMLCTELLPHFKGLEAVQDGYLYRNCIQCKSTLLIPVEE